jgi:hypothetical protein
MIFRASEKTGISLTLENWRKATPERPERLKRDLLEFGADERT